MDTRDNVIKSSSGSKVIDLTSSSDDNNLSSSSNVIDLSSDNGDIFEYISDDDWL